MNESANAEWALNKARKLSGKNASQAGRLLVERLKIEDYIGSGVEKDVFSYDDEKVVAFFPRMHLASEDIAGTMKSYFYATKLAHLLLPKNIPDVHLAGSSPPVMILDRVNSDNSDVDYQERYDFRRQLEKLGIADAADLSQGNLLKDQSGELVYVDIVNPDQLVGNRELDSYVDTLDYKTRAKARRLQSRLVRHLVL